MNRLTTPPALVALYLSAILLANVTIAIFGPAAAVYNGLLLISLDLATRDSLHDLWGRHGRAGLLVRLGGLIVAGSALSYALSLAWPGGLPPELVGGVALASCAAFGGAALVDTLVYAGAARLPWLVRANLSNAASALVDSVLFVGLAPVLGWALLVPVALPLFAAKVAGGLVWSLVLRPREVAA